MFVRYIPKHKHAKFIPIIADTAGAVPNVNDSLVLAPGVNEITEEQWAAVMPHLKEEIARKEITAFTVPMKKADAKAGTLKNVPLATARKLIEGCNNRATIKRWFKQELPDEIMLLVAKRLRKLKIDPDEIADLEEATEVLDSEITLEDTVSETVEEAEKAVRKVKGVKRKGNKKSEGSEPEDDEDEEEIPDFDGLGGKE
jgi:hypothetical protein